MKTMYLLYGLKWENGASIKVVEVESETDCFIVLKGERRKTSKSSERHEYFNTWEEAHQSLLSYARDRIEACKNQLDRLTRTLIIEYLPMKPPEPIDLTKETKVREEEE